MTTATIGSLMAAAIALTATISALAKWFNWPVIRAKWNGQLAMPDELRVWAGVFEFASGIALLFPITMHIGAIGLSIYLGGAIALHARIRITTVCVYAVALIALTWISVHCREI